MAKKCAICGKMAQVGSRISHAHNVSKRRFNVNLQSVRIKIDGRIKRVRVCTGCLSAGKVVKA
ncbi:MAG: 50S ribosomal protein L28 [candidate division WOR-3 bacterium]|nr:50S ribosomal protein L28 [candidate division WOR-3 bacterium]